MQRPTFSIYNASAGSGKTYSLVKEYLKIILTAKNHDAYRNILAITFTNKAVHEMKSRIVGNLSEFSKENPNEKAVHLLAVLAFETKLSEIQIKTKSKQIIKHIIHNYAAFDISTIDKFTHKVIRAFAHDLGLPMTFEVSLDTENLLIEAVDSIISKAGEDETLTNLLIDFTLQKTDDDKSWDISREILETGRLILNENNRNEITHFQDKSIAEFIELKDKLNESCKLLENANSKLAQKALLLIEKNGIDVKSFSGAYFPKHLQSIEEGNFNPKNKTYHEFDDIRINKTAKDRLEIENIIPELLQILTEIYKSFEKRDFYVAFLKNITPLSLLNTVSNELSKIQEEQNLLSISEFNAIIHREIQNQPAPFIYERMGEKYRHFFIDEFQDTSEMQWQNLIPLIGNALDGEENGEKGTLMIVGDPKQSIYRWRGGKAEQFIELAKGQKAFPNHQSEIFHLDKNFRSYSQVIDFNNDFFKLISNEFEQEDFKDLYANQSFQKSNNKIGGYVNISFIPKTEEIDYDEEPYNKTQLFVEATLKTINKTLENGFEYRDIVVLTRKRSQGIAIANYLTEKQVPILSSETLMIQNATEVRFIIHLLKYLKNKSDLESKSYFLHYLSQNNQKKLPTHDFIAKGMVFTNENDFENWLASFDVALSFENIRKKSLYEAVEIIVSTFLKLSKTNAYIQFFMDIVLDRDVRNQAGISDFLNYWDKNADKFSIPSPEGKNAVRIMTIHKSKGLEFPVVIIPFAEEDYNRKPKDKLWITADEEVFNLPRILIDNTSAVERFGTEASNVYSQKKQEELLDNINVLYVALTRVEEQLYIISQCLETKKDGSFPDNMASFFIKYLVEKNQFQENCLEYEIGNSKKLSSPAFKTDDLKSIELVKDVLNPKNIKMAQKEALMWGTIQQEAIEYGNVIHEILSFIKTEKDIEFAITKALENGLITMLQKGIVTKTISKIVNHPELISYFSVENKYLNEQTIIQKEGNIVKPDRMVITQNNEIYILDYKTGIHNEKYQLQLEKYQIAIELMDFRVVKKSLVYIGSKIEVVNF